MSFIHCKADISASMCEGYNQVAGGDVEEKQEIEMHTLLTFQGSQARARRRAASL